jgi:hypothetical protein
MRMRLETTIHRAGMQPRQLSRTDVELMRQPLDFAGGYAFANRSKLDLFSFALSIIQTLLQSPRAPRRLV